MAGAASIGKGMVRVKRLPVGCDLARAREVFIAAFTHAYAPLAPSTLSLSGAPTALREFLEGAFASDAADFSRKENAPRLYLAEMDGDSFAAGYLSVDVTPIGDKAYLRQLAVSPALQRRGVGRALIAVAMEDMPDVCEVSVSFRAFNKDAERFYRRLGFGDAATCHGSLDKELYRGLVWKLQ